ncbi:NUDIX hydrolase [Flavobacterium psychrophilum]|uniref:MutT/nudix family protein n=1 Tax=Flavobacterium psychrophilum (strain ATCC 49511 / DSM 21280 / CIP 103535 / JIP02/86) TaxID=402612 RepID=A6GY72_FLAPJ|nr:NUDIX hydrolase [Flavobacterium psychrophilum]AIG29765.1 NUDIX hydrolase [Flavobacterium psychrophilum]AIG32042.1 NUDIX hydrolase [Flavobacterium psychrophilum]AIG34197.1 NUDIX hydrolase [Flavobacterium psychrophilum]AIG36560.1 NUDIX hydrolase [Flavobacterium psychrophilum]AIG38825.1 NUDIX hydrolase [Flavobacterium psychrophilum]
MRTSKIFVTVDAVIIRKSTDNQLLLIKRKNEPFQNCWALPGGFVDENEDLEVAAKRELEEETQIKIDSLQQFGTFGKPFRDPRGHMISVAYFGEVPENTIAIASDDAKEVAWFAVNELPNLAFDHQEIIEKALKTFKI